MDLEAALGGIPLVFAGGGGRDTGDSGDSGENSGETHYGGVLWRLDGLMDIKILSLGGFRCDMMIDMKQHQKSIRSEAGDHGHISALWASSSCSPRCFLLGLSNYSIQPGQAFLLIDANLASSGLKIIEECTPAVCKVPYIVLSMHRDSAGFRHA